MIAVPRLFLEGICQILETEKGIEIVARASTQEGIIPLVKQKKPEVLFLDTALSHSDILTFLESIRDKSPETKVLLLPYTWNERLLIDALFLV